MSQYRHRRLVSIPSFCCGEIMPSMSRARKVSTEADIVVSFVKSRVHLPYSTNFEKKFYLKRNSDIVEERMCYNTRFDVKNRKELLKVLKLVTNKDQMTLESFINRGCVNETVCAEFVKANLVNVIPIHNINTKETNAFVLRNISYDACANKYTKKDIDRNHNNNKVSLLKNLLQRKKDETKIGDIYFEFSCEALKDCCFYVIMQVFEKPSTFKNTIKQRLKKTLIKSTQEIRRFNLPVPCCVDGEIIRENNMEELLELDIFNWKLLDYKFKSSKDECFYKQIRRKNRALSQI